MKNESLDDHKILKLTKFSLLTNTLFPRFFTNIGSVNVLLLYVCEHVCIGKTSSLQIRNLNPGIKAAEYNPDF